ncbi:hypothetical protein LCGC14_2152600 [marine sediment metagenome]|uniref:Uncharacterized protein n=1 Tax=marine sediment metagenome TaxID=412755 RepID=A0A0F9GRH4_9ZZZZ
MTTSAIVAVDPRADLIEDMARDMEGHFHRSIAGDRRLPPWFGSESGSQAPPEMIERLHRFINERCVAQPAAEYDIRHNWFDNMMDRGYLKDGNTPDCTIVDKLLESI